MDGNERSGAVRRVGRPGSASGAARAVFGRFSLDCERRILTADGQEVALQPRTFDVLELFVTRRGEVLSGDEIVSFVWRGVAVGDNNLGVQLSALRRALAAHGGKGLIVTLPGRGYRFVGDVTDEAGPEPPPPPPPHSPPPQAPASARPRRAAALALICGTAALAALIASWRLHAPAPAASPGALPKPRWVVQGSGRLLPEPAGESNPRISPDGSMLAYTVGARTGHGRIYVRALPSGEPQPVSPLDEDADSPAWASDGLRLAYAVADPDGAPCRIMVTAVPAVPAGPPRLAGRCQRWHTTELAWQPGTPFLFLEDGQAPPFFGAIFKLDVESGAVSQVTTPLITEDDGGARVSPDGAWLAYVRGHGFEGAALRLRSLASGDEREIDCDPDVSSIEWTSDSTSLIATVPRATGGEVRVYPIDGASGYQLYVSSDSFGRLATGPGGALAAEVNEHRTALARARTARDSSPDLIESVAGMTAWPSFAPDGTLAFVSNRSNQTSLWTRKPGGRPVEIVKAGNKEMARPVWSPDGDRIAFYERWAGQLTIGVVTARGDAVVSFEVPSIGFGLPSWTPDGEHLVIFDKRIQQAVRVDLRNPGRREPVQEKLQTGITYRNGSTYSTSATQPGIWQLDGGPRLITRDYPPARSAPLAFLGDDVLLPGAVDDGNLRILAQPLAGGQARLAFYAPAAEPETPLAVDPLTGGVIYVSEVAADSHIDLIKLAKQ